MATYFFGVVTGCIAVFAYLQSGSFPTSSARLPLILSIILGGLSVMMLLQEYLKGRKRIASEEKSSCNFKAIFFTIGSVSLYIFLIQYIGYVLSTVIFVLSILFFAGDLSKKKSVMAAVLISLFVFLIFIIGLKLPLPVWPLSS